MDVGDRVKTKIEYRSLGTRIVVGMTGVVKSNKFGEFVTRWPIIVDFGSQLGAFNEEELEVLK